MLLRIRIAALLVIAACTPAYALTTVPSVAVMADSSMSIAIAEIARDYSRDKQTNVNASFAPSTLQQTQISEGASVDVLITPHVSWIDQLRTQGLIDVHSQSVVAKNQLVLAGPAGSPLQADLSHGFPVNALIKQLGGEPGFVVGNPETMSSGAYSKETLRNLGAANELEPYTLYIRQLDEMFDMVTKHQAYGLFFYSSTVGRDGLRIIGLLPESSHRPINYYAVVLAGENMDQARKFLEYLKSPDAQMVFRENGFGLE